MTHLKITNHRGEVLVNDLVSDLEVRGWQVFYAIDLVNEAGETWSRDQHEVTLQEGAKIEILWETSS